MKINVKGVFISGIVAGIIISISAITMVPVVGNEMDIVLANRGLPPLSNAAMAYFCFISFIFGIALMSLYVILKPRFDSKIKTAIIASVTIWILAYLINNISLTVYGFMPIRLAIIGSIWGLMELLLASIISLRLYKEAKKE